MIKAIKRAGRSVKQSWPTMNLFQQVFFIITCPVTFWIIVLVAVKPNADADIDK